MRRINIFGGPGVGKSTLAAQIFGHLRQQGQSAELVQEWFKTWAYAGHQAKSFDYVYAFANQLHAEDQLLQAGVKIIISDSPMYLQCIYAYRHKLPFAGELLQIAKRFEATYPSINFVIDRPQFQVYEQAGRYETLDQAIEMDRFIVQLLDDFWAIPFKRVRPGDLNAILKELV
jgi:RecA/RadA recombinase